MVKISVGNKCSLCSIFQHDQGHTQFETHLSDIVLDLEYDKGIVNDQFQNNHKYPKFTNFMNKK